MLYKVFLLPQAEKSLKKLYSSDRSFFDRIRNALDSLKENPHSGKPLKDTLKGKFSLRVGVYRIIYSIDKHTITIYVLDIGHRREVYR